MKLRFLEPNEKTFHSRQTSNNSSPGDLCRIHVNVSLLVLHGIRRGPQTDLQHSWLASRNESKSHDASWIGICKEHIFEFDKIVLTVDRILTVDRYDGYIYVDAYLKTTRADLSSLYAYNTHITFIGIIPIPVTDRRHRNLRRSCYLHHRLIRYHNQISFTHDGQATPAKVFTKREDSRTAPKHSVFSVPKLGPQLPDLQIWPTTQS
jgi:hypothetical protein